MIEVSNITKIFQQKNGNVHAVDGISFRIEPGEAVAFIGPNGAGKSTMIKILTGILWPTDGEVSVFGLSPQKNRKEVVRQIGAVFGQRSNLLPNLPARDTLRLFGSMYGMTKIDCEKKMRELIGTLVMEDFFDRPVRTLSLGQRMRVEIACALIHSPKILFLDEPTIGLDIIAKQSLRETLHALKTDKNVTIFLTSHDVGDIEAVCERTILINHGRIVVDEPTGKLRDRFSKERKIRLTGPLVTLPESIRIEHVASGVVDVVVDTEKQDVAHVLKQVLDTGYTGEVEIHTQSLEDVLVDLYSQPSS